MDDDETGQVIKNTDLSNEAATDDEATWSPRYVDKSEIEASRHGLKLKTESALGGIQNKTQSTLYLAVADAAVTLGAFWIGIPAAAAVATGTVVTIIFYLLIHFTSGQRKQK